MAEHLGTTTKAIQKPEKNIAVLLGCATEKKTSVEGNGSYQRGFESIGGGNLTENKRNRQSLENHQNEWR